MGETSDLFEYFGFNNDMKTSREIGLPFKYYWKQHLLSGRKTCTTRVAKHGNIGDTFTAFGGKFKITDVKQMALKTVRDDLYLKEGCSAPAVFEAAWCSIHPLARFKPELQVYVHFFERIG